MPFDVFSGFWGDGVVSDIVITGDLPTITVTAPTGVLSVGSDVVITGNLPTIAVSAPSGALAAIFAITPAPADVVRSRAGSATKGAS